MPNVTFLKLDIGGRSLILHKIEAKRKELDIVVASLLEQLTSIVDYCNDTAANPMKVRQNLGFKKVRPAGYLPMLIVGH